MKQRLFLFVVVVLLAVSGLSTVAAQDEGAAFAALNCLNLSEEDCALVTASLENAGEIQSLTPNLSLSFSISGAEAVAPGMGLDNSVTFEASGPVVIDHEAMKSDDPVSGVSVAMDISTSATNAEGETSGSFSFVIVDGVFYMQHPETGDWKGAAIAELMDVPGISFMGMSPEAMMGAAGENPMGAMGGMMGMEAGELEALLQTPGFLTQERLDDETVDGQTMYVFVYTTDLAAVLGSEQVQEAFNSAVTAAMAQSGGQDSQQGAMAQQMAMMLPVMLQNTTGTATLTRWIGADDGFVHKFEVTLDGQIDLFGGATNPNVTPIPPIVIQLDATVELQNINDTAEPVVPEGAEIVPASEFMPDPEAMSGQ